jgi:HK97 family phage major capsid protein
VTETTTTAAVPDRLYAALTVSRVDETGPRRRFAGLATTPTPDRRGDVIDPTGLRFANPISLLLHHDVERPIGFATLGAATEAGVAFEAELADVDEPGPVRDRITEAWQSIKAGLLRGVSIGILRRHADCSPLRGGGQRIKAAEIVELSVVTIPMNREASILTIKALDSAAFGLPVAGVPAPARVPTMNLNETAGESILKWETTRANHVERIESMITDAETRGETLNPDQATEYENLKKSITDIDAHLDRLRERESLLKVRAVAPPAPPEPLRPRAVAPSPFMVTRSAVPKGTAFTRYAMALAASKGNRSEALEFSKQWRDSTPEVELVLKAAVAAGTTTDAVWAGPLVPMRTMAEEFMELLRPATIIGRIPGLRRVPFNTNVPIQTGGGTYGWVGQGAPKPVTSLTFGTVGLGITKCAGIIVLTEELVRVSSPSAEAVCRADMIAGIAQFLDAEFVDPAKAGVTNVAPASILNGITPIASGGPTAADAVQDLNALIAAHIAAGRSLGSAVLLMSEKNAFALASSLTLYGSTLFPGLSQTGGNVFGVSTVTSSTMGTNIALIDPSTILLADDGQTVLDSSREASVQMDSAPDNPALATTVTVSLWQHNLVGLRAERFINWKRGVTAGVHYVSGADYSGAVVTP